MNLLDLKSALENECSIKQKIVDDQNETINYMENFLINLENCFYDLIDNKIDFNDFLSFLYGVDNKHIYDVVLKDLINNVRHIDGSKKSISIFYDKVYDLSNSIKNHISKKKIDVCQKKSQLDKLNSIFNNISNSGDFILPLNESMISDLMSSIKMVRLMDLSLMREITLKNNEVLHKIVNRKNAKKIRGLKKFIPDVSLNTDFVDSKKLSDEQQKIVDSAKKLVVDSDENLRKISDEEKDYLDFLYQASNESEIVDVLSCMNSDSSSLSMILFGISFIVDNISSENAQDYVEILKVYINLYDEYSKRIENDFKNKDEFEQLIDRYSKIEEIVLDDSSNIFGELNSKQIICLDSFKDASIDDFDDVNETLNKFDLDFYFLAFYNEYVSIFSKIKSFKDNSDYLSYKDKISKIREIYSDFEKYDSAKNSYIEANVSKLQEVDIDDIDLDSIDYSKCNNLIFLTDSKDGVPYMEKNIKESKYEFGSVQFSSILFMINVLRTCSSTLVHSIGKMVKPDYSDYKKKRLAKHDVRLVFIQVNNKNVDKPIFLVITGGVKHDSKHSEVYDHANHLKQVVIDYIEKISKMSKSEIEQLLKSQVGIEEDLIKSITPKKVSQK